MSHALPAAEQGVVVGKTKRESTTSQGEYCPGVRERRKRREKGTYSELPIPQVRKGIGA